jgi:VIT1/CCC1 family predicted Fe2+/Mn2+ transporter
MDSKILSLLIKLQRNEITEHYIYNKLARIEKNAQNRSVLERIASDELNHYQVWKKFTNTEVKPSLLRIWWYYLISRILGLTFGIKLMEKNEGGAQNSYKKISQEIPEAAKIEAEENEHEQKLISLIDEERLSYVGSMVLGLNDALVELTGALAGFSLALQNSRIVALTGMITGIAASLSMAASEYLSTKSEKGGKNPIKASVYTGIAYVITVIALIMPYIFISQPLIALLITLLTVMIIIALFTYYVSIAMDLPFLRRFLEMAVISLGVASVTFGIGFFIRKFWNIEI